jgi:hypothetical protein
MIYSAKVQTKAGSDVVAHYITSRSCQISQPNTSVLPITFINATLMNVNPGGPFLTEKPQHKRSALFPCRSGIYSGVREY